MAGGGGVPELNAGKAEVMVRLTVRLGGGRGRDKTIRGGLYGDCIGWSDRREGMHAWWGHGARMWRWMRGLIAYVGYSGEESV